MVLVCDKHQEKSAEAKPVAVLTIKDLMYILHSTSVHKIAMLSKRVWFLLQFYVINQPKIKNKQTNNIRYFISQWWNLNGTSGEQTQKNMDSSHWLSNNTYKILHSRLILDSIQHFRLHVLSHIQKRNTNVLTIKNTCQRFGKFKN